MHSHEQKPLPALRHSELRKKLKRWNEKEGKNGGSNPASSKSVVASLGKTLIQFGCPVLWVCPSGSCGYTCTVEPSERCECSGKKSTAWIDDYTKIWDQHDPGVVGKLLLGYLGSSCGCPASWQDVILVYFYASLNAHVWCLLLAFLCLKKPTTNHLDGVTHPHRGVRVFNTALGSCPPPSEVSPHAPWVLHNCSGEGGRVWRSRWDAVQVLKSLDDKRFCFFFLFLTVGIYYWWTRGVFIVQLIWIQKPPDTFPAYVIAARQQSGNNGGNNLGLCLKSIIGPFRRIPLSSPAPRPPHRSEKKPCRFQTSWHPVSDGDSYRDKTSLLFIWSGDRRHAEKKKASARGDE